MSSFLLKNIYIILALGLIPFSELSSGIYPQNEFGLTYSMISGAGLSWKYRPDNDYSIMLTGGAYYMGEDPSRDHEFYGNLGVQYMHDLFDLKSSTFYGFIGTSFWHLEEVNPESEIIKDRLIETRSVKQNRIGVFGAGVGYDIEIGRRLALSAQIGLLYQISKRNDYFHEIFDRARSDETQFWGAGGGISVRYRF